MNIWAVLKACDRTAIKINRRYLLFSGILASSFLISRAGAATLRFGGVAIAPGQTVRADVPLNAVERSYAADATRNVPPTAVAVMAVPPHFDPGKTWPVLVVFSTSD